jgi:trehalose 6-phosphate phosphatase
LRDLLSAAGAPVIAGLARPGTLLVFDFDGTLAPLVRARGKARLGDVTRRALARVAEAVPTAVLSGRAWPDLAAKVSGVPVRWAVGGHGAEWPGEPPPRGYVRRVAGWRRRLDERLDGVRGVDIEDKEVSLSIHWRAARDGRAAGAAVARAAADLPGARLVGGKRVLNVVPAEAPDKGDALARLVAESGCERVLFVGDDVTDEAGFRARLPVPSVMVRVGRTKESAATWFVQRRGDVDRLLERLVAALAPSSGPRVTRGRGRRARGPRRPAPRPPSRAHAPP